MTALAADLVKLLDRAQAVQDANRESLLRLEQERRTLERIKRTPVDDAV